MPPRASALILVALAALFPGPLALAVQVIPPVCNASISGSGSAAVVNGSAADGSPQDPTGSGIVSVVLDPASVNINLAVTPFTPPVLMVTFSLNLIAPATSGKGTAIATDALGNQCRVGVAYTPIAAGAVLDKTVFIDTVQGVKLHILNGNVPTAGTAVVASAPPGPEDVGLLPGSYGYSSKSLILDLNSPTSGRTTFAYDIDIPNPGNLRLVFRRLSTGCGLEDITESVEDIVFDPRVKGTGPTSPVQFAMAASSTPQNPTCDVILFVPTLSDWGLFVTALLMLTGLSILLQRRPVPAGGGREGAGSVSGTPVRLLVPAVFGKIACGTLALAGVGLAAADLVLGAIDAADIVGAVLSALILAYLIHLWVSSAGHGPGE